MKSTEFTVLPTDRAFKDGEVFYPESPCSRCADSIAERDDMWLIRFDDLYLEYRFCAKCAPAAK